MGGIIEMSEFNLSDKVKMIEDVEAWVHVIPKRDVKEFIKRLKEELRGKYTNSRLVRELIDKLAGEELI